MALAAVPSKVIGAVRARGRLDLHASPTPVQYVGMWCLPFLLTGFS